MLAHPPASRRTAGRSDIARRNTHAPELNVLVVGMPNVGKSTLLNALRNTGIPGRMSLPLLRGFLFAILTLAYLPFSDAQGVEDVRPAGAD